MTGLVGLELGSRILGLADFIAEAISAAAAQDALLMRAAPSHLGRLNSIIIFIVLIIFFSSSAPPPSLSPSTPGFKAADVAR